MVSLRLDHFNTKGDLTTDEDDYKQTALSPKFGLVYQVLPESFPAFAPYMNGFVNVAPATVSDINGENPITRTFEAQHANQADRTRVVMGTSVSVRVALGVPRIIKKQPHN